MYLYTEMFQRWRRRARTGTHVLTQSLILHAKKDELSPCLARLEQTDEAISQ